VTFYHFSLNLTDSWPNAPHHWKNKGAERSGAAQLYFFRVNAIVMFVTTNCHYLAPEFLLLHPQDNSPLRQETTYLQNSCMIHLPNLGILQEYQDSHSPSSSSTVSNSSMLGE
jgi:hypothetical protein